MESKMSYVEAEEEELYNVRMKEYEVPWWVKVVSSIPKKDLTFEPVSSGFNIFDPKYREAILFWVAIPTLWLLLTLFFFLIYFCYRCCQTDVYKRGRLSRLKWILSIFTIITCGAVAVGICGNEDTNKGVSQVISSVNDVLVTVSTIRNNLNQLLRDVNKTITRDLVDMASLTSKSHPDIPDLESMRQHTMTTLTELRADMQASINSKFESLQFQAEADLAKNMEYYRRSGTLGLFGWFIFILLILLAGIGNNSRCVLLLFCAFGIFSLVISGLFSGVHLGLSILIGDFCSEPDAVVSSYMNSHVDQSISEYYIRCDIHMIDNPFSEVLKKATESLINANHTLMVIVVQTGKHLPKGHELWQVQENMVKSMSSIRTSFYSLVSLVECTNIHKDYLDILEGVCYQAMPGVLLMLISSLATGIFFSLLIILASKVWKLFSVYKSYTEGEEDEGGPFIAHQQNSSPSYYGYPKARPQSSHIASYNRRTTPPPAYNSNEFYRQYNSDINNERNGYNLRESNA